MTQRPRRDPRGRILAALSALARVGLSCAPPNDTGSVSVLCPPPPRVFHGVLVTGGAPNLPILDPAFAADTSSHEVVNLLYDGLVTLDPQQRVEPWGAVYWRLSPDDLTYTFHLRPGQFFSDGAPVHASDYAFAINRALNPCLASPLAFNLFAIKDAATFAGETCRDGTISAAPGQPGPVLTTLLGDSVRPDDAAATLTLILAQPSGSFLSALTTPAASALEPSVVGSDITSETWADTLSQGASGRGTSGMYHVTQVDRTYGRLSLQQNPHWWGRCQPTGPFLTEIDFTIFKDAATEHVAYRAGQFDVGYPPVSALAKDASWPDYHAVPTLQMVYLLLNWNTPPFDNRDARLAFCLAIDRQALNLDVFGGAMLPTWHLVPQGMPGYNPDLTGPDGVTDPTGDAARAQAHWHAYLATLHGKVPPSVTFSYDTGSASQSSLAGVLQQQWLARLHLNVSIAPYAVGPGVPLNPPPDYFVHQAVTSNWHADYPDPQDVLSLLILPGTSFALGYANVPQAISLLQQADAQPPSTSRLGLYQQTEALLVNQVVLCPLLQAVEHYDVRSSVLGWSLAATGFPADDTWRAAYLTAH